MVHSSSQSWTRSEADYPIEVVVKTRHLLVVSERSQRESQERGGKALVMGTILR